MSWRVVRAPLRHAVVPIGSALAAGAAAAAVVPPRWHAPGLPAVLAYGKNVETTAVAAALVAAVLSLWLAGTRRGRAVATLLVVVGFGAAVATTDLRAVATGWPQLLVMICLATVLGELGSAAAPAPGAAGKGVVAARPRGPGLLYGFGTVLLVAGFALAAFVATIAPLEIDVFHHGEVLASALDLLHGGRPFKTFIWPHGLHDTGLAALWIAWTGKVGTSPVALAAATCAALGVVTAYCVGRRVLGTRGEALVVCGVLSLAPFVLRTDDGRTDLVLALQQLGKLLFVALAFAAVTAPRRARPLSAGIWLGLAHLFRIETAVYGAVAAAAVLVYRRCDEAGATSRGALARAVACGGSLAWLMVGAAAVFGTVRLALGWPGSEWFAYTLGALPRYHRDAVGIPFAWPWRSPYPAWASTQVSVAWIVFVVLLAVQAARAVRARGAPSILHAGTGALVFLATFAALAMRSSLERSDAAHVLQWSAFPLLGALLLVVALLRDRLGWSRAPAAVVAVVVIGLFDFGTLGASRPRLRSPAALARGVTAQWRLAAEHLAPNPPQGACADTMFTASEARLAVDRRFIRDTCVVEALLRAHHVRDLVIAHSAPWYYVRFGLPLPTRYFAFARAYTPAAQLELTDDLRARRPQALLQVAGYGALPQFDVPDALRVPVVDAWLRERRRGASALATPLGRLVLLNEPAPAEPAPEAAPADPAGVRLVTDIVAYEPMAGVLFARGWAVDTDGRSLRALAMAEPALEGDVERGLDRPDLTAALQTAAASSGWELALRLTPTAWEALRARGRLELEATRDDGRRAHVALDLTPARVTGRLSGREWEALPAAVDRATALGRADRAVLTGAAGAAPAADRGDVPVLRRRAGSRS